MHEKTAARDAENGERREKKEDNSNVRLAFQLS